MNCEIIKDLIPLYIDGCCSEESEKAVEEHIGNCCACEKLLEEMQQPTDMVLQSESPKTFSRINSWKASVMQSVLLFVSFGLITVGVAFESYIGSDDLRNGFFAMNLVVPATGFMLSLANWYFVRFYKNRKVFSSFSSLITFGITFFSYVWSCFHYEINLADLFSGADFLDALQGVLFLGGIGFVLTFVFCVLSKVLSAKYAEMSGKE